MTAAFAALVSGALKEGVTTIDELATEHEVAKSTVTRWAKGTARPHRLVQATIAAFIEMKRAVSL